jgi:hypothetical protein
MYIAGYVLLMCLLYPFLLCNYSAITELQVSQSQHPVHLMMAS